MIRFIPSLKTGTLKLINKPVLRFVSFRYVISWAVITGKSFSTDLSSTITLFSTIKSAYQIAYFSSFIS